MLPGVVPCRQHNRCSGFVWVPQRYTNILFQSEDVRVSRRVDTKMGMWDGVRSIASKAWYWNSTPDSNGGIPYFNNLPKAVAKIGNILGPKKLEEYVPNPEQRDKIRRIVSGLSKLAIDTAVNESLKGITGGAQVYKILKEGLKDRPELQFADGNNNPEHALVIGEMQAKIGEMQVKIEKMQEELNFVKQKNRVSTQCTKELTLLKQLKEHVKESDSSKNSSGGLTDDALVHPKTGHEKVETHEEVNQG